MSFVGLDSFVGLSIIRVDIVFLILGTLLSKWSISYSIM